MKKQLLALALVAVAIAIPAHAFALVIAPPPGPTRVAQSDAVVVGRVIAIEPTDVEVKGAKYTIAIVQVSDKILGVKDEKMIRVGFIPPVKPIPGKPISSGSLRNNALKVGQEGLFMMQKHPTEKFFLAPQFGYFTDATQKNFNDEVKSAKKAVAIMADPKAALQSKNAEDRLLAASLQVARYRSPRVFPNKQEPIDAEESKLLLETIVNSKWEQIRFGQTNAYQLFLQLGITEKDGWTPPRNVKSIEEIQQAAQTWYREKGGTYRIQRFVPAEKK